MLKKINIFLFARPPWLPREWGYPRKLASTNLLKKIPHKELEEWYAHKEIA